MSLHRRTHTLILTAEHPLCPSTFLRGPETLNRRAAASVDMLTEGLTRYSRLPVSSTGAEPSTRPAGLAGASRGWACVSSLGSSPVSAVRVVHFAPVPCSGLAYRPAAKALRTCHRTGPAARIACRATGFAPVPTGLDTPKVRHICSGGEPRCQGRRPQHRLLPAKRLSPARTSNRPLVSSCFCAPTPWSQPSFAWEDGGSVLTRPCSLLLVTVRCVCCCSPRSHWVSWYSPAAYRGCPAVCP